jgi:hypothetical protein
MEKEFLWLQTSLFADRSQWDIVLKNGIRPFLAELSDKKLIGPLLIEFNYLSGENIRLAIQTETQNAEVLADKFDDFFKEFFLLTNLQKKEVVLPIDSIFLPFPANTIQYGLYKVVDVDDLRSKIISKISFCIIDALEDDTIDEEVLITFAFYLHIALITQLEELCQSKADFLSFYNSEIYENVEELIGEQYLVKKYEDNKASLIEIEESIRNYQEPEFSETPPWLIEWIESCKEIILSDLSEDKWLLLVIIRENINRQLGLTNNMRRLVNYFINSVYSDVV